MNRAANFRVDPKLAALLGEGYRSTEHALKELVDNAWDAEASTVWINLPPPMSDDSIRVRDDGCGMTDKEVQSEYLVVANDRRSRKGERTPRRQRLVKGRKGIGKFAGLVAAEVMQVQTEARGRKTTLRIVKRELLSSKSDLERIPLPLDVEDCDAEQHGTTIMLSQLNDKLSFPSPETLRELLVLDYGREQGFDIFVNGESLSHDDLRGESVSATADLPNAGAVTVRVTVMEQKAVRQPGIVLRVGNKVVGKPSFFGLDEREDIPKKLLNKVVGEIEAPGLEGDVTADWGAVIANSKALAEVQELARKTIEPHVEKVFKTEINLARARLQREINRRLEALPEHRRKFASDALDRAMRRFYGESEDRIAVLVNLVLDAFEKDEYWVVCKEIEQADHMDVQKFAQAIEVFGLVDMAAMAYQGTRRLQLLDQLDELRRKPETLEAAMHKALEKNLWVLGPDFGLMYSNKTLATVIGDYCNKKFAGARASRRPDLLLAQRIDRTYLLIEFKRPSYAISRTDENQAAEYRDDLSQHIHGAKIRLLVVGGSVEAGISSLYSVSDSLLVTYADVISNARTQLDWLIGQLTEANSSKSA